jgi:hypothetical protein
MALALRVMHAGRESAEVRCMGATLQMLDRTVSAPSQEVNRRRHRRLEMRLPVECRHARDGETFVVRTVTQNISTGGMYFELDRPDFAAGDEIDLELTMPAAEGVYPYEGRASCSAKIIRADRISAADGSDRFAMAAEFRDRLRLRY